MDVTVELNEGDIARLNSLRHHKTPRERRLDAMLFRVVLPMLLFSLVWYHPSVSDRLPDTIFIIGLSLTLPLGVGFGTAWLIHFHHSEKPWQIVWQKKGRSVQVPVTCSVTKDGIAFKGELVAGRTTWDAVDYILPVGTRLFVFVCKKRVYIFPERAFPTPEEAKRFVELVHEYKTRYG